MAIPRFSCRFSGILNLFRAGRIRNRFLRILLVALAAFLFFKFICKPVILNGKSMEPGYRSFGFNFCWTPAFRFRAPKRGDVVVLTYEGDRVMLLKRIVGLPGETLEIRDGIVQINGTPLPEPYVVYRDRSWTLPPRKIPEDSVYVIGDNRGMPMRDHFFGAVRRSRILGALLL